jgi:hypothetical protein
MLPFAFALMALPLLEIGRGLVPRRGGRPGLRIGASIAVISVIAITGGHFYFHRWGIPFGAREPSAAALAEHASLSGVRRTSSGRGAVLQLMKAVKSVPRDQVVLVTYLVKDFPRYLKSVEEEPPAGEPARIQEWPDAVTPERIREISCRQRVPFAWITGDTAEQRQLFSELERDFAVRAEVRGTYRIFRISGTAGDACRSGAESPGAGDKHLGGS